MLIKVDNLEIECRDEATRDALIVKQVVEQNLYHLPDSMLGQNVLDVGGHIGSVTLMAAKRGAKVWVFEPELETYNLLVSNLKRNGITNVHAFNMGLGTAGLRKLYHHPTEHGSASAFPEQNPELSQTYELMHVLPLEYAFYLGAETFDFMKLDCEGGETEVIPQLLNGLYPQVKRIGLELHYSDSVNEKYLNQLGDFYTVEPLSHIEFLLTLKENYVK